MKVFFEELPKDEFDECIICGEQTKGTAFCKECWSKHNDEELLNILNTFANAYEKEKKGQVNSCILCGEESGDFLFCKDCYKKFKGKILLLQIKVAKNQEIQILNDVYEGKYVCKDGHIVKSKSERDIDNYLFEHKIMHAYEKAIQIDENEENDLHPDFCLIDYLGENKHVYIEHWGYGEDNKTYNSQKNYKLNIYKEIGATIICTNEQKDAIDIEATLNRKLNKKFIKPNKINFL